MNLMNLLAYNIIVLNVCNFKENYELIMNYQLQQKNVLS